MTIEILRAAVRDILRNADPGRFTVQGFGFLRYRFTPDIRMHVWDSSLRNPGVSDIHDHTQWAFTSHIVSGQLVNQLYVEEKEPIPGEPMLLCEGTVIRTGIGGGIMSPADAIPATWLRLLPPQVYVSGGEYHQNPDQLHRTMAADGTITIIKQERRPTESARVFWPVGGSWGDAVPRQAMVYEVEAVIGRALEVFGP